MGEVGEEINKMHLRKWPIEVQKKSDRSSIIGQFHEHQVSGPILHVRVVVLFFFCSLIPALNIRLLELTNRCFT
jgi:hypothetical protein